MTPTITIRPETLAISPQSEYYRKFGFDNLPGLALGGVPPEVFHSLSFDGRVPQVKGTFDEAFVATA